MKTAQCAPEYPVSEKCHWCPQVAGCGHQHYFVSKETDGEVTETQMNRLDKKARLQELARLLGGSEVTRNTLANAKELLAA